MNQASPQCPNLIIVQNRETQFDAPLYSLIQKTKAFPLHVIYTTPGISATNLDPELGFAPQWDHLNSASYSHHALIRGNIFSILRLAILLKNRKPSLVLICGYYPYSHLFLALALFILRQKIGLRSDNLLVNASFSGISGKLRKTTIAIIQRLFDTWHPVGSQSLDYLRSISGSGRPSYRFAYSIDNDWFRKRSSEARQVRASFLEDRQWPSNAFVLLGIMKWSSREDPLTLLRAFQDAITRYSHVRLVLVGDGPLRSDVISLCSMNKSEIYLPGYSPYSQLPFWYGVANLFIHPSPQEPWGVSVLEALASGLPVFAAQGVGAALEILQSDHLGAVFENGNHKMLADLICQEIQQPKRQCPSLEAYAAADKWHYRYSIEYLNDAIQEVS